MCVRVDFLASDRHYVDHLLPVYSALPSDVRGEFITGSLPVHPGRLTVVSSFGDYRRAVQSGPVIYFEHGAGQSYSNDHPSYAGGAGKDGVVLFCSTNGRVDALNRRAYPNAKHAVVGCPKLDAWHARGPKQVGDSPKVAFSFHWNCTVVPETKSAFPFYSHELNRMVDLGLPYVMLGHGHPRAWPELSKFWRSRRVKALPSFADVVTEADVYVVDNSSTLYEFAALDRPVVVLNAPWYRRDVHHGLRFWGLVPGQQVNRTSELSLAVAAALRDDPFRDERRRVVQEVYPFVGESTGRAVDAILGML